MLEIKDIKNKLKSYNLNTTYGPTIYQNNNKIGLALDIKDSTFGYLTRCFTFDNLSNLDEFLNKYLYYRDSSLDIKLSFDDYLTKEPNLIYTYDNNALTWSDMHELPNKIIENKNNTIEEITKQIYLLNIEYLTKYYINLLNTNINNSKEKNNLKIEENDLKYTLLQALNTYYDKNKNIIKKGISLDTNINTNLNTLDLENNLINLKNEPLNTIEDYLKDLITKIKKEELDEKNIINAYSNLVYKYNIAILTKQIAFVNNKITSEKNFNLKGSKIHNIDAELKSFLKTNDSPPKYDKYIANIKNNIAKKYNNLDLEKSYFIISGNPLQTPVKPTEEEINPIIYLNNYFNNLEQDLKASLILYNSFYKKIINFIIDNNYPSIDIIKDNFDLTYYYDELDEIIHNKDNIHLLNKYFYLLNFKNINNYLNSLINIAKIIDNCSIITNSKLLTYTLNNSNTYKELNLEPLYNKDSYLIEIKPQTHIIYINKKLIIDPQTNEITLENTNNIYYKGNIKINNNSINVNRYQKINTYDKKNDIIITKELTLIDTTNFKLGEINNE